MNQENKKIDYDELFQINEDDKNLEQNKFKLNEDETTKSSEQISLKKLSIKLLLIIVAVIDFILLIYALT